VTAAAHTQDSTHARRLWLQALERHGELNLDSALALLRAAQAADPGYLPAHFVYIELMRFTGDVERLRTEYRAAPSDTTGQSQCLAAVAAAPLNYEVGAIPVLLSLERRHGPTDCVTMFLADVGDQLRPQTIWRPRVLEYQRRAVARWPEVAKLRIEYATVLELVGRRSEAAAVLLEGITRSPTVFDVIKLQIARSYLYQRSGDPERARAVRLAVSTAVRRDHRPGVGNAHLPHFALDEPEADSVQRTLAALARATGAWPIEWNAVMSHGMLLLDYRGDPQGALKAWDRAVAIVDSVHRPALQLMSHVRRGRALSKLGRLIEAERTLRRAIAIGRRLGQEYNLAEAYHNLAHVYESAGRFAAAAQAADSFVLLTRPLRHAPIRMMSLHDAGTIRWKAGWHAAAAAAFSEMVRVVDELETNYYWAGEFYERSGDLERAIAYYRRGAAVRDSELSLCLAGLTRSYEALGLLDSAAAAAQAHDRVIGAPFDVPLLPRVLTRLGQLDSAETILRDWAQRRLTQGNRPAAAQTMLHLADLLLGAGRAKDALGEAQRAETMAVGLNLTDELIRARRLQGQARLGLGEVRRALALLELAARMAAEHPTTDGVRSTQLALADGLSRAGRRAAALAAYDRAAQTVEQVTSRLSHDLDRARYRDVHLAPFDGALRTLLAFNQARGRLDDVAAWSARRKAAALALSAFSHPTAESRAGVTVRWLQGRLREGEALLDYIVLDDAVAVLFVTRRVAELVSLPVDADSIRQWARRLRQPFITTHAGRVDLARAVFDFRLARALYNGLIAPLEPLLATTEGLIVAPDGPVHYVPFGALVARPAGVVERAATGRRDRHLPARYAIDRFEIRYVPSTQLLTRSPSLPGGGRLLAVTRAAPGGDREVTAIGAVWPADRFTLLADDAASESAAHAAAAGAHVLHFAVHAQADDHDPLASHLRLGADDQNDGYFHLAEIAAARLPARLVVLSACETQSGRLFNGEGLMGLARAFLAGGGGSVVATQWPVGPSAADLMGEFYRRLAAGTPPATALRAAELSLRRDPATAHPFYWAGFVLVAGK